MAFQLVLRELRLMGTECCPDAHEMHTTQTQKVQKPNPNRFKISIRFIRDCPEQVGKVPWKCYSTEWLVAQIAKLNGSVCCMDAGHMYGMARFCKIKTMQYRLIQYCATYTVPGIEHEQDVSDDTAYMPEIA